MMQFTITTFSPVNKRQTVHSLEAEDPCKAICAIRDRGRYHGEAIIDFRYHLDEELEVHIDRLIGAYI